MIRIGIGIGLATRRAGFSPAGQVLFLRADRGVTLDGSSNLDTWTDTSTGIAVTQPTAGLRPPISTSAGRPAVNFSGGKWLLNAVTALVAANSAYTVIAVGSGAAGPILCLRTSNPVSGSLFYPSGADTLVHNDGVNASHNVTIVTVTAEVSAAFNSVHRYNGGANNPDIFINGTQRSITSVGTSQATEGGTAGFFIGKNVGGVTYEGMLNEIRVLSHAITAPELVSLAAYLHSRYTGM